MTDRQGVASMKAMPVQRPFPRVQIPAQGHQRPRHQLDEAIVADTHRKIGTQMEHDLVKVVMCEGLVMAPGAGHEDRHHLAECELA